MKEKILITDDEKEIAELAEWYLKNDGFETLLAFSADEALRIIENSEIDLAILDVMLPDMSGFDLCRKIREKYLFPIIMLTARSDDMDKINGLTIGADDYITKPFNPLEMAARVRTLLRRRLRYDQCSIPAPSKTEYDINGLYICPEAHTCTLYGRKLSLTPIEFKILCYLCERQGSVVSSEELFEQVWGEKFLDSSNTVMAHIARLREKMGEPPRKPKYIKTVWGVGYKIEK